MGSWMKKINLLIRSVSQFILSNFEDFNIQNSIQKSTLNFLDNFKKFYCNFSNLGFPSFKSIFPVIGNWTPFLK